MQREALITDALKKLQQLPDDKIQEVSIFIEQVLSRLDDAIINEGVKNIISNSKSFEYLREEEDLYSVNDLKEKYK